MDEMSITNAQYFVNLSSENSGIKCTVDGEEVYVPLFRATATMTKSSGRLLPVS